MPYRTSDEKTEGVVITFEDVTERRRTADALTAAKRQAELATIAKSRFLAAASHDLRQPLQTLALLQGLLAKKVDGDKAQKLVGRIDEALGAMTGMLNTLLDINQIEVGAVKAEMADFSVNELFDRLRDELTYHAQAAGLALRVVPCALSIRSDPRLLEQMIRNLLSNALKYTQRGKVLVGCRRRGASCASRSGTPGSASPNPSCRRSSRNTIKWTTPPASAVTAWAWGCRSSRAWANCLAIRSACARCKERARCSRSRSRCRRAALLRRLRDRSRPTDDAPAHTALRSGAILIIEDDPEVREHLELFLKEEGYDASTAVDGPAALEVVARRTMRPDLVLADYNLPNGMNGVQVSQRLRQELDGQIPFIILTGDISTEALRDIALHDCVQFNKPVKLRELTQAIEKLLAKPPDPRPCAALLAPLQRITRSERAKIFVVDDDDQIREAIRAVLEDDGRVVETYASCEAFLDALSSRQIRMPADRRLSAGNERARIA